MFVVSMGSVQAGSFSPQLPDPLESPTQADPPSDLSLPTSQLTSGIAVMSINPALMSNPPAETKPPQKSKCTGCGRGGHMVDTCRFTAPPFYNSTNTPYLESKSDREMLKKHPQARWIPSESAHCGTHRPLTAPRT
jgi:hypothetical protein